MAIDGIHPLGVNGDTGEACFLTGAKLLELVRQWRGAGRRLRDRIPPGDLAQAGWGVVFPSDGDPNIRAALAPLLRHRQEQAGELFQELSYRKGEGVAVFRSRLRTGFGPVDPNKIPYYLLLVGDPSEIPHGFQAGLDIPHAVGRLVLPSVEAYSRYAEAVRDAERAAGAHAAKLAIFGPTHEGDKATKLCEERMTTPLSEVFARRSGGQLERAVIGHTATQNAFLELLESPAASLVLAAGHGVYYDVGHHLQRRLQGSLVCADWPRKGAPIEMDHILESSVIPSTMSLAGRIFFFFGCYTAGTPQLNSFDPGPRAQRRLLTETPFSANLPQVLLERGALAVIAHVDQAFPDAFLWEKYGQLGIFEDALASMLDGNPVGLALEGFGERYAQIAVEMVESQNELGDGDIASLTPLLLWTAYHDARGIAVLGDPAVRLAAPILANSGHPQ